MLSSYANGAYRASEQSVTLAERSYKPNGKSTGCLFFHGGGVDATSVINPSYIGFPSAMAAAGIPVLSCDYGDPTVSSGTTSGLYNFGNDNAITSVAAAKTFLQAGGGNGVFASGPGASTSKFVCYAGSMGATTCLNYLRSLANPASVCSAVVLVIPVLDINDVYQNNKAGVQANAGGAYGVTFPTALPNLATHSPVAYSGADLAKFSMPIHIYGSSNDPIASDTTHCQTWATSVGSNVSVVDLGAVGHVGSSLSVTDLLSFVHSYI